MIYEEIKKDIETHKYGPNDQLPTEVELARTFEVSVITSKRALSELQRDGLIYRKRGKGTFVRPRCSTAVEEPTSRTNGIGSNMVSIVLPSQGHGFTGYIRGAADFLNKNGYYLSVHSTEQSLEDLTVYLWGLRTEGMRSIIYYPQNHLQDWEILMSLHFNQCSVITIDQQLPGLPIASVVSDNFSGGQSIVTRLIELGHRRIAYISSTRIKGTSTIRDRFFGYCSALQEHGIPVDPNITIFDYVMGSTAIGSTNEKFTKDLLHRMMALNVTAIVAEHDFLAFELMKAALNSSIKVPEALSIVGFDDLELSAHLPIPLTTVKQSFYDIGRKAAEIALQAIELGTLPEAQKHIIPVSLIERSSTGAVNSSST